MPTYQATLMDEGQPLLRDLTVTLVDMNTGLRPAWRGSFSFPGDVSLGCEPYQLALEDGRTLNIEVDQIQRMADSCYATFSAAGPLGEPEG